MAILIVAESTDPHTGQVSRRLREKGAKVVRFDVHDVPKACGLSAWASGDQRSRVTVRRDDSAFDLDDVDTVWFRRPADVSVDDSLVGPDAEFARREAAAFVFSIGVMLSDRFCVNPIASAMATDRGNGKVSQLELARGIGMQIPRTLVTNDPADAADFLDGCGEGTVYKALRAPTRNVGESESQPVSATILTTKLDAKARASLDRIRFAPCIFQELVPKQFELRVTVMGHKIFATEIHSQVHEAAQVDFRRHYALDETPYAPHQLPADLQAQCRALNRALGLVYGAYDFIYTPDGRYVFLEVNQAGQFLWLEEMTGQPLLENFCELLMQRDVDFRCDTPSHAPGPLPEVTLPDV